MVKVSDLVNTGRKVVILGYYRSVFRGPGGSLYTMHGGKPIALSPAQKKRIGMVAKKRTKSRSRSKGRKRSRSRKRGRTPEGYIRVPSRLRSLPQMKADLRALGAYGSQVNKMTHRGMMSDLAKKSRTHMGGKPMTRGKGQGMYPISGYDSYRVMYKPRGKKSYRRGYI